MTTRRRRLRVAGMVLLFPVVLAALFLVVTDPQPPYRAFTVATLALALWGLLPLVRPIRGK